MKELSEILIVEDDPTIRTVLELALLGAGYSHVTSAARGDEGLDLVKARRPDLVLLDVMLPGLDGFTVARRIRETPALAMTRVIMLTARTQNEDIVRGLESGADDYVTKPFDRQVLLARVAAVLRRGAVAANASFDGLVVDGDAHVAKLDGADLPLAPGELKILALLVANRGRVLARSRILDHIQSEERSVTERTVDVQIANLRKKLGGWADHVETIRGVGYRVKESVRKTALAVLAACAVGLAGGAEATFDAGADLRIRQEILDHVPGYPNGGVWLPKREMRYRNQLRFRVRPWMEERLDTSYGKFRLNLRLNDEFRHYIHTSSVPKYEWPDEVIVDNLFLEGKGLWDGFVDFKIGRQDIHFLYDLEYVFDDGTPGDASRSFFGDLAGVTFHVDEQSKLDLFGMYNCDENVLRWGCEESKHRSLTGLGGGAEPEMDDWGFGAIWASKAAEWLPYQLFVIQKNTAEFERKGETHPWTQRELIGTRLTPRIDEEWSLDLQAMGQVGCNGDGATLSGWFGYSAVKWRSATKSSFRPYANLSYKFMSGDDDAADEDGGHGAWDPMWARGIADSILFAYGTNYGVQWWSNVQVVSLSSGLELGPHHKISGALGPMFAAASDGMGGGNGMFKGFLYLVKYDFPLLLADPAKGERLEIFGHLYGEFFNPGDYFESRKGAWMFRWQIEVKF